MENNLVIIIPVVVVFIAYFVLLKSISPKTKASKIIEQAIADNTIVTANRIGNVIHRQSKPGERERYIAKYEYVVDGRSYKTKIHYEFDPPYEITLYYKKGNPRKAIPENPLAILGFRYILLVYIIPFIFVIIFLVFLGQYLSK